MDVTIGIPRRLAHLPLVMDTLRKCGIFTVIDQAITDDPRCKVTTSQCVAVILCGVYLGHHDLWRLADRLAPYDMKTVLQDPGLDLTVFTEERLAKALDDLHAANLDKLMTPLVIHMIEQFGISTDFLHFDTTSLTLFGAYEDEEFGSQGESIVPTSPIISFGYSKDHRPDLKQIMFGTLVSCDGGIPLYGKALDGNRSDNESAAEFFSRVRTMVKNPKEVCCVADSKGWCARVLHVVQNDHMRMLSRLPRNHSLHAFVMAKPWDKPERIARLKPNGKPSKDYYDIIGHDVEEVLSFKDAQATPPAAVTVAVPSRALRVFSSALFRQKLGTLERTIKREKSRAAKCMKEWGALAYACEEDALRAGERLRICEEFLTLDITATVRLVEGPFKRGRGRPSKRPEPGLAISHCRIDFTATPVEDTVTKERLALQASFVLIRTRNKGWKITDGEMIERYKGQYFNEHGFSWLKSGSGQKGINPMYLSTPSRMASLCFLYVVGLMSWTLIQRTVRGNLKKWKQGLPYHRNKPSERITTRFFFELFPLVQVVPYTKNGEPEQRQLVGITPTIELACKALGTPLSAFMPKIASGK